MFRKIEEDRGEKRRLITKIESKRLLVISDLHLGNPFSRVKRKTVDFLHWIAQEKYDLCINGDGFEVAQASLSRLSEDVPEVLQAIQVALKNGCKIYYVVGNHDILFEHFLTEWGGVMLSPFLNVNSCESRFRVEHGHLYDPFFIRYPRLYEFCVVAAGFALKVMPSLYFLWIHFEKWKARLRRAATKPQDLGLSVKGIVGEHPSFFRAACQIEERGFDGVVFGHTHHRGVSELPLGGKYLNSGSWMLDSSVIKIEEGRISMCRLENGHLMEVA